MKIKIKISAGKIIMGLLVVGIIVLARYAMRDMNLDVDLLRESLLKMPGLVVENIQFSREVSGDLWHVKIPYLERDGNLFSVKSLDVIREISGDNGEWKFIGDEGIYSYDKQIASVKGLHGTLDSKKRVWNLESPKLNWTQKNNTFVFPEGLVIYDTEVLLRTPLASMDNSGVILLEQGGVIQWVKPITK